MTTLWYQHPECLEYSTDPCVYFIHGHRCTHEVFTDSSYKDVLRQSTQHTYVYAHHPLMNEADCEYTDCCADFGYALPRMYYAPLCTADTDALWTTWTNMYWYHRPYEIAHFRQAYTTNVHCWTTSVWQRVFPNKSYQDMIDSFKT